MENRSTYKTFDLSKATVYDIATDKQPALPVDFENEMDEEQERILLLYFYANYYELTELKEKLEKLYEKEISSFS